MYDVAIIGCGVIGAAAAYALSRYDNKVVILEAENDVQTAPPRPTAPFSTQATTPPPAPAWHG